MPTGFGIEHQSVCFALSAGLQVGPWQMPGFSNVEGSKLSTKAPGGRLFSGVRWRHHDTTAQDDADRRSSANGLAVDRSAGRRCRWLSERQMTQILGATGVDAHTGISYDRAHCINQGRKKGRKNGIRLFRIRVDGFCHASLQQ